jgi:hypothetical protein
VHLEEGEQRHGLGEAVLVAERLVEVEAGTPTEQLAQSPEPAVEGDRGTDVAGIGRWWQAKKLADRPRETIGVVDLRRGIERGATKLERQGRRAIQVAVLTGSALAQVSSGVAVTAILEHSCEQLLRGFLRRQLELVFIAGKEQP